MDVEKERIANIDEPERARQESSEIRHLTEAVMQLVENKNDGLGEYLAPDNLESLKEDTEQDSGLDSISPGSITVSEGTTELAADTNDDEARGSTHGQHDELKQAKDRNVGASMLHSQEVEEGNWESEGQEADSPPRPEPVPFAMDTSTLSHIVAVRVTPEEEEERIRRRILDQAVQADMIVPTEGPPEEISGISKKRAVQRQLLIGGLVFLGLVVGLVVGLKQATGNDTVDGENPSTPTPSPGETSAGKPTLQAVQERGVLCCGIPDLFYLFNYNDDGEQTGFDIDLCKALAAGILGDNLKYKMVYVQATDRFTTLAGGSTDVLFRATPTIGRDLREASSGVGLSFSYPYYYGGIGFGGKELFVCCADEFNTRDECMGLMVCTGPGTTHTEFVKSRLPSAHILIISATETIPAFNEGRCNVIFGEILSMVLTMIKQDVFGTGNAVGKDHTYEGLSIVTRDDDVEWSEMVNWILQSLFEAEKLGITQDSADAFKTTSVFGAAHENIFRNAIGAAGNYGEIYDRHLGSLLLPRSGMLMLNTNHTSGILWAPGIDSDAINNGPEPIHGGELERVSRKEYLTCGIANARPGFAEFNSTTGEWSGLDVDICRAVGSSIFFGLTSDEKIRFVEIEDEEDGFGALADRSVDILCGQRVTLGADVTGYGSEEGAAFSVPYFYDQDDDNRALAVRQKDVQWSSFVYWIVACTIYAAVANILQATANEMPITNVFGAGYRRMFRDAILAVGNYGEMYHRHLESLVPRSGLNLLNVDPVGPQIFPLPFDESVH